MTFKLEQPVTVTSTRRKPKDGVVAKRTKDKRYTILYDDDTAEPLVHEDRIHPKGQMELA